MWLLAVTLSSLLCSGGNRFLYAFEVLLFRLLIAGLLQPLCAVFTALLILPVASLLIFVGKLGWTSDNFVHHNK